MLHQKLAASYSGATALNEEPFVCTVDDFVSEKLSEHIISVARDKLAEALVSASKSGVKSAGRSGKNCWIPHKTDGKILGLVERICSLVKLPRSHAESLQVIYYGKDQQYKPHFDAWDASTERGQRCMARGGQRLVTCLIYLNTPKAGGGTSFPELGQEVQAKQGKLTIFHSCYPGTIKRHPHSLHGGMPVAEGEKWACNLWFRDQSLAR